MSIGLVEVWMGGVILGFWSLVCLWASDGWFWILWVWDGWYVGGFGCCVWFVLVGFGFCRGVAWRCFPFVGLVGYLV